MSGYEDAKPNSWRTYLNANNFYGFAMSEYLPTWQTKNV